MPTASLAQRITADFDLEESNSVVWETISKDKKTAWIYERVPVVLERHSGKEKKEEWMEGVIKEWRDSTQALLKKDSRNGLFVFSGWAPGFCSVFVPVVVEHDVEVKGAKHNELQIDGVGFNLNLNTQDLRYQEEAFISSKVPIAILDYAKINQLGAVVVPSTIIERVMIEGAKTMVDKSMLRHGEVEITLRSRAEL